MSTALQEACADVMAYMDRRATVDQRTLEPGLTAYQISAADADTVQAEITRLMNGVEVNGGAAEFSNPRRCFDINEPVKRWRSRGYVRARA